MTTMKTSTLPISLARTGVGPGAALQDAITSHALRRAAAPVLARMLDPERFADVIAAEATRHRRFLGGFSLVRVKLDGDAGELRTVWRAACTTLARVALEETRDTDVIGRVTESELAVLCPQTGAAGAARLARRIVDGIREAWAGQTPQPRASAGHADTEDVRGIEVLMLWDAAGDMLAEASAAGGGRVGGGRPPAAAAGEC